MIFASAAQAQEQEHKLVDRLLRPDTTLSNSDQDKQFTAVEGTSSDKKFVVRQFYSGGARPAKSFSGGKSFLSKIFRAGKYARAEAAANTGPNAQLAHTGRQFQTSKSSLVRKSSFAGESAKTRDYADNRPFLGEGTRQKQLSQQDHPMTIDEVRELLNKSR
ncbi:MAG: hypothetical protein H0X34_11440 [Chthoniobacterales bacterium]|nr:hypothetical protein [Chthoniobacterales bacterium]